MRSARVVQLEHALADRDVEFARTSACSAVAFARRCASQPTNQRAMRRKRGHQNARASGIILQRREMLLAERQQRGERVGRQALRVVLGEIADRAVDHGAAVARAGRRVDGVERRAA